MTIAQTNQPAGNPFNEVCGAAQLASATYANLSATSRADFLEACADRIDALGDELTAIAMEESHLPAARLEGERKRTTGQLRMFASLVREGSWVDARIDTALPDRQPLPKPDLRRMLKPLGPVVVFGASNFPLAFSTAGGDTASALAAGCVVIHKAHPAHLKTGQLVAKAIGEAVSAAGLPDAVFQLVQTDAIEDNLALVRHPLVKAVGFTGSLRAGRALMDAAASRPDPIPVFAEMGSTNPVILAPGAVRVRGEALATGLAGSVTVGVGQFCTNPGVILMLRDEQTDGFLQALTDAFKQQQPGTMLHEGIAKAYRQQLGAIAKASGVETLVQAEADGDLAGGPALLKTTADQVLKDPALLEECFGPSTLVVTCASEQELLGVLGHYAGQLTGTIQYDPSDDELVSRLLPALERCVGRVIFNGYPTGVEVCPSMHHGGPYPASSDARFTSVGTAAIDRFARPVCYQDVPDALLPEELRNANPRGILRLVNGQPSSEPIS